VVQILYVTRAPDDTLLLIVQGLKRFRIAEWIPGEDFLRAKINLIPEIVEEDIEIDALHRSLRDVTQEVFSLSLDVPGEAIEGLARIKDTLHLAYIAAAHSEIGFEKRQALLSEDSLKAKLRELVKLLSREKEVLSLGKKIKSDAKDEMSKSQKDYYLRQQLKAIKKELGELDDNESDPNDYRQRIAESDMTDEARKEALREWDRLE
jgi:ATP-dependent Lon protease